MSAQRTAAKIDRLYDRNPRDFWVTVGARYLIRKDEMDDLTPFELDAMVERASTPAGF